MPTASGWSDGNIALAFSAVATGIDSFSANAISSARASDAVTPPPATITGRCAWASRFRARAI